MSYKIICASSNTSEELKIKADYICDEPFFEQGHGIRVEATNYFNTHA